MKINNLISIPIYEFQCDISLTDEVCDEIENYDFTKNTKNSWAFTDMFYHEKLFEWFDQCLDQLSKKYFLDDVSLPIVSCWINRTKRNEYHHSHWHTNSIIAGVFYLTTHDSGKTVFYYEDPFHKLGNDRPFLASKNQNKTLYENPTTIIGKVKPEKGKLILFPSNLHHGTESNMDLNPRYSISFDTFFSGLIKDSRVDSYSKGTEIILNPTTVAQRNKNKNG
jgi:hypothetical protein